MGWIGFYHPPPRRCAGMLPVPVPSLGRTRHRAVLLTDALQNQEVLPIPPRTGATSGFAPRTSPRCLETLSSWGFLQGVSFIANHLSYRKRSQDAVVQRKNKTTTKFAKLSAFWKWTEPGQSARFVFQGSNGAEEKHLTKPQPASENSSRSPLPRFSNSRADGGDHLTNTEFRVTSAQAPALEK